MHLNASCQNAHLLRYLPIVVLTLQILRQGKRFFATTRFEDATKLDTQREHGKLAVSTEILFLT